MRSLIADLTYAARRLRSAPGFTATAVLTVALGIAATTTIYSVVDALMLRPLPYREPGRLVDVGAANAAGVSNRTLLLTTDRLAWWRGQTHVFESVEAYRNESMTFSGDGEPQRLIGAAVTGGLMRMLGVAARTGRTIEPDDALAGRPPVVVLSEALWRTRFASAADIVGRTIRLNATSYTIVGVMPERFTFPYGGRQFWTPLVLDGAAGASPVRLNVTARVRADLSIEEARSRAAALTASLVETKAIPPRTQLVLVPPIARHLNAPVRRALYVLAAAVSLVLLIACANLASLLLVQGAGRAREIAVRLALGASRRRLVRQFLTETVLLSVLGGLTGLLLAHWAIDALAAAAPRDLTFLTTNAITLDARVLAFTAIVTVVTSMAAGVLPALRGSRQAPNGALADGRSATATPPQERLRRGFVLAQVALSLLLLVGAGLLIRTLTHLTSVDPGFDPRGMVAVDLALPQWKYRTAVAQDEFFDALTTRLRGLPAVGATTITGGIPPGGGGISFGLRFEIEGRGIALDDPNLLMPFTEVDGDYFATMGIPFRAGRTFGKEDARGSTPAIVIGESMARRLWPNADPIGQRIRFDERSRWYTVVGVVGDVYQFSHDQPRGQFSVYYPNSQSTGLAAQRTVVIRTTGDPGPAIREIRQAIWSVDRDQPIGRIETIEDAYADFFAAPRFYAVLMSAFALIGLAIAAVGLYGALAYAIAQRTREFGIRTALGAQRAQVLRLAMQSGLTVTAGGLVLGLLGSIFVGRALGALLVEVSPTDPAAYLLAVAVLGMTSLLACWVPARRATMVDPAIALRHE
jgi:putative ABC transport system permease protein